ncbi:MAG: SusC/RagA family TonB-linked outer membrane protein, partial [Pricia sp.]
PITGETVNVVLQEDADQLEEVVVVGYGTQKKSDVTGSVASVNIEEATAVPTTNVSELLRGRAAGVQVNLADARPGGNSNIVIRGKVSLEGNDPLIIVDGIPYDNINDVAAEDIVSVEVLKDASSQAIYGARAANGVILITTKRGKEGKFNVDYHGYTTIQTLTKNFDLYSAEEFAQLRREANRSDSESGDYLDDSVIFNDFELESLQNRNFVDWEELVLEDAVINSHSLSVSDGGERTQVYTSLNYFDQDGLIPTSGFERGTFRLNVDQQITDKFSLQANINLQNSRQDIESSSLNFISISPLAKPFDEEGNLVKEPLGTGSTRINPLWNIRESDNEVKTRLTDINLVGNYQIIPSLSYKLNTFLRNRDEQTGIYRSSQHSDGDGDRNGRAILGNETYKELLIENIVNYIPEINEANELDFTFVNAISERRNENTTITKQGFPNDALGYNGNATEITDTTRDVSLRKLVSFLGRARYNLLNRYLLTLTARADASTVFAENNKWGFFPAAALAWKMHEEEFLKGSDAITQMKLRVSYGDTGNEGIQPSQSLGVADDLPYVFGGVSTGGFAPLQRLPNPALKWETTTTLNVGLDFGLFKNVLTGSLEYYKANTTDFLLDRLLSGLSGYSVTRFNIGEVENKGFEATLNGNIIRNENLNWSMGLTFSTNDNKVLALDGELDENGEPLDFVTQGLFIGEPIDNIYQFQFDGIWQEGDDIANSAQPDALPGDIRVIDRNDDGEINDDDRVIIDQNPNWYGSINTTLEFKGFELFADFYIVQGATRLNNYLSDFDNGATLQGALNGIKVDYYLPEDPSTEFPQPRTTAPQYIFALAVRDASYTRLRTLSLGYNIPVKTLSKIGLANAKVYVTGTNLFTFTDYRSYSPENNAGAFPDAKGLTVGVRLGL